MPEVRQAKASDVTALSGALARSFHDDPVMAFIFPPSELPRRLAGFFAYEVEALLKHDEVWTTDDATAGGALWAPPGKWRQPFGEIVRSAPKMLPLFGARTVRALRTLAAVEKVHPREPHYYLAVLGTEPAMQGKGVGSALLAPVLGRCDTEGVPAYLESSKETNLAFYARHGFVESDPVTLPGGGPNVWPMWREPRSA
ncbi:MAG TPA: GNAT family N-acetyltransferase [Acidimicrobiales bacterium]|nr:GNAT family N-acetyltransferase [Acidimicrobiales bacterium]